MAAVLLRGKRRGEAVRRGIHGSGDVFAARSAAFMPIRLRNEVLEEEWWSDEI